jgi:hypothetical protein
MRETTAGESKTAVAWYHPEQWERLREVANDVGSLERTHDEWRKLADKTILDLVIDGIQPVKVYVDIRRAHSMVSSRRSPNRRSSPRCFRGDEASETDSGQLLDFGQTP